MTDVIYPPEYSMSGRNRYYHRCDPTDAKQHYGVCLFVLDALERGRALSESPCTRAVADGRCPALKMREEERQAGRALYYDPTPVKKPVDRPKAPVPAARIDYNSPSYLRGRYGSSGHKNVAATPTAPQEHKQSELDELNQAARVDYAQVVNTLIREEPSKLPDPKSIKPLPGESPLAFARRRKQLLAGGAA